MYAFLSYLKQLVIVPSLDLVKKTLKCRRVKTVKSTPTNEEAKTWCEICEGRLLSLVKLNTKSAGTEPARMYHLFLPYTRPPPYTKTSLLTDWSLSWPGANFFWQMPYLTPPHLLDSLPVHLNNTPHDKWSPSTTKLSTCFYLHYFRLFFMFSAYSSNFSFLSLSPKISSPSRFSLFVYSFHLSVPTVLCVSISVFCLFDYPSIGFFALALSSSPSFRVVYWHTLTVLLYLYATSWCRHFTGVFIICTNSKHINPR